MYIIGAWHAHAHANAFYGHEPNIMYVIWLVSVWRLAPQFLFLRRQSVPNAQRRQRNKRTSQKQIKQKKACSRSISKWHTAWHNDTEFMLCMAFILCCGWCCHNNRGSMKHWRNKRATHCTNIMRDGLRYIIIRVHELRTHSCIAHCTCGIRGLKVHAYFTLSLSLFLSFSLQLFLSSFLYVISFEIVAPSNRALAHDSRS